MNKKIIFKIVIIGLSIFIAGSVYAQDGGHECDPQYVYCFDWENAEYSEVDQTYCDENACAYPPGNMSCFLNGSFIHGHWCAIPNAHYTESDSEPMTSSGPHTWTIPPPPEGMFENDDDDGSPAPTPIPQMSDAQCPAESVVQAPIRVSGELVDPPFPVVVGQDPAKRGADLVWRVEIPPVIHTWYERKEMEPELVCSYVGDGSGGGCPGPGSQYSSIEGAPSWDELIEDDPNWQVFEREVIECVEHVDIYPERLNWVRPTANLFQESRDWIEHGGLQQRYPGAHLYQPDWEWVPPLVGTVLGEGTYVWEWMEEEIQFRDPGQYGMSVKGGTSGTPVTGPRFFELSAGEFSAWLYEATLTK